VVDLAGLEMGLFVSGGTGGLPPLLIFEKRRFSADGENVICNMLLRICCCDYTLYL
jgi:hypothetical protein